MRWRHPLAALLAAFCLLALSACGEASAPAETISLSCAFMA